MTGTTTPLTREHQLLLQRIMASHCVTHEKCLEWMDGVGLRSADTTSTSSRDPADEVFTTINQQLSRGFGLEVATVVVEKTQYHAVINLQSDEVASSAFDHHFNGHEKALIRLILQELVDKNEAPRKDLINLRGSLEEPYKLSTIAQAEHVVTSLLDEQWLRMAVGNKKRRESLQASLELAPRCYLELGVYLQSLGLEADDMPQALFHRL